MLRYGYLYIVYCLIGRNICVEGQYDKSEYIFFQVKRKQYGLHNQVSK